MSNRETRSFQSVITILNDFMSNRERPDPFCRSSSSRFKVTLMSWSMFGGYGYYNSWTIHNVKITAWLTWCTSWRGICLNNIGTTGRLIDMSAQQEKGTQIQDPGGPAATRALGDKVWNICWCDLLLMSRILLLRLVHGGVLVTWLYRKKRPGDIAHPCHTPLLMGWYCSTL